MENQVVIYLKQRRYTDNDFGGDDRNSGRDRIIKNSIGGRRNNRNNRQTKEF